MAASIPRVTWVIEADAMGGAERYLLALAEALAVRTTVISLGDPPPGFAAACSSSGAGAIELVRAGAPRSKLDVVAIVRLAARLRRTRPDLVHVNANMPTNARYAVLAALLARLPVVATVHTEGSVAVGAQQRLLAGLFGRCARVIAVSERIRAQLVQMGTPSERVVVIRNGVEVPTVGVGTVTRGAGEPLTLGLMGRLTPQKGVDLAISALSVLAERGVGVRLVVAGEGPELERLREQAGALGVDATFVGQVSDAAAWWSGVDVAVLPSRHEGLPFVLLEAMAYGVPVIATDVGSIAAAVANPARAAAVANPARAAAVGNPARAAAVGEPTQAAAVADQGQAAVLIPPEDVAALADAVAALAVDPAARARLGAAGRAHVRAHLSASAMAEQTAQAYAVAGVRVGLRQSGAGEAPS